MLWHVPGPPLWAEHSGSMEGLCGTACGPVETLGMRGREWAGVHEQETEGGRHRCSVDRDSGHHFNSLDSLDQRFSTWTLLAFGAVQLFVMEAALRSVGRLAASLTSARWMHVAVHSGVFVTFRPSV